MKAKTLIPLAGMGILALTAAVLFVSYLFSSSPYLSMSSPPLDCDPDKCASKRMLESCSGLYLAGALTEDTWTNCVLHRSNNYAFLSVSTTDSRVWVYDLNRNCYLDESELVIPKDKWRTGRDGGETLDVVVACINAQAQHVRNPSCPEETPHCTPSCPEWPDNCAISRTCIDAGCNEYEDKRTVDTCMCLNTCGDGQCICGETSGTCPQDCGETQTTTTIPAGLPDPSASSSPMDALKDFFKGFWDWITGLF